MANKVKSNVDQNEIRYRIRPQVNSEAEEDHTALKIDTGLADHHGVTLDPDGFPTSGSLEAWHRKNNPHLFTD